MINKRINIIIAGEGGQGVQTMTDIFCKTVFKTGFEIAFIPYFGVEQRGAPSISYIAVSNEKIYHPKFEKADYIIVLQKRAIKKIAPYSTLSTQYLFDSSQIDAKDIPMLSSKILGIPATSIAKDRFNQKSANLIILGAMAKLFNLDKSILWSDTFRKLKTKFKTKEIAQSNKNALFYGYDYILEDKHYSKASFMPSKKTKIYKNESKVGSVDPKLCKGCGICLIKCPVGAIRWSDDLGISSTPVPEIDLSRCIACGNCKNFCPDGAIGVEKINHDKK